MSTPIVDGEGCNRHANLGSGLCSLSDSYSTSTVRMGIRIVKSVGHHINSNVGMSPLTAIVVTYDPRLYLFGYASRCDPDLTPHGSKHVQGREVLHHDTSTNPVNINHLIQSGYHSYS